MLKINCKIISMYNVLKFSRWRLLATLTWWSVVCLNLTRVGTSSKSVTWPSPYFRKCPVSRSDIVRIRGLCYVSESIPDLVPLVSVRKHIGGKNYQQFSAELYGIFKNDTYKTAKIRLLLRGLATETLKRLVRWDIYAAQTYMFR
jgi:hypothetical protein